MSKLKYLTLASLSILGSSYLGYAADAPLKAASSSETSNSETDLSLSDILNLGTSNVASLVGGTLETAPATVNVFSAADIAKTPSRTLTDFFDKSLPGFDSREQMWVTPVWGFRGILNDRNESILMNVNGEMQNNLSKAGIQGETVLGLMGDIKEIQTISGPGSVVHGPGALAGVINVELKDGRDEKNNDQVKLSIGNQGDISSEYAHIARFDGDRVLRIDGGYMAHHYEYTDGYAGPSGNWAAQLPEGHSSGRKWPGNYRLTSVYTDKPNKFRAWFRYTSMEYDVGLLSELEPDSGTDSVFVPDTKINNGDDDPVLSRRHYQRNLSVSADKAFRLSDSFELKTIAAITMTNSGILRSRNGTQFGRNNPPWDHGLKPGISWDGDVLDAIGETRFRLRSDLRFINDLNPFVIGAEIRHDRYEGNLLGGSYASALEWGAGGTNYPGKVIPDVNYINFSSFAEYQNHMLGKWLVPNLGARVDLHSKFTTFAPRVALTGNFLENHNYRIVAQQSYKALSADNINGNMEIKSDQRPDPSTLKPASNTAYEVGYQYKKEALTFGGVYYTNKGLIYTWNNNVKNQEAVSLNTAGFEINAGYNSKDFAVKATHSHVKLGTDPQVPKPDGSKSGQIYSRDGSNFYSFSPDITRLQLTIPYAETWESTLTARAIWGNPGLQPEVDAHPKSPNIGWLTQTIYKLDLQMVKHFASSSLMVNFENLTGYLSAKNEGRFASSFSGTDHDNVLELTDKPRVQVSYILQF